MAALKPFTVSGSYGEREETGNPGTDQLGPRPESRSGFPGEIPCRGNLPYLGILFKKALI